MIFDKKEDVIEIQLTSYGKKLLSEGNFDPIYYSFSDEDIVYDSSSFSDNDIGVQQRILSEIPRLKPQYNFSSVEEDIKKEKNDNIRDFLSVRSLGTSSPGNNYMPAWEINFYSGNLVSTTDSYDQRLIKIPQLNVLPKDYRISVVRNVPEFVFDKLLLEDIEPSVIGNYEYFEDGSLLEVIESELVIEINENNSPFNDSNVEIEIFKVEPSRFGETLKPLFFTKKEEDSNIFIEKPFFQDDSSIDSSYAEYYFDIEVDREIPPEVLCKYIPEQKRRGIYSMDFKCPEKRTFSIDPYDYEYDIPEDC